MIAADPTKTTPAQRLADIIVEERDLHVPVPVETLVRECADLRVVPFEELPDLDALVHGLHGSEHTPTVLLNASRPQRRKRFTLGHEYGHISMAWHVGTISCHPAVDLDLDDETDPPSFLALGSQVEIIEREADLFASRLLVPNRFVRGLDLDDPASMLEELQKADVSPEAGIYALAAQLAPGYVFALLATSGQRIEAWTMSHGTVNLGLHRGQSFDPRPHAALLEAEGQQVHHGRRVWWGRIVNRQPLTTTSPDWRPIWKEIFSDSEPGEPSNGTLHQRALAVASTAHGDVGHEDLEVLARRIKHHFLRRDHLVHFVDHPRFDEFASARAVAFQQGIRRNKRKKDL